MTKDTLELDAELVMESLEYTRLAFQGYDFYASEDERQQDIARVDRSIAALRAMMDALSVIREQKLYRSTHDTFEDYCRERWGVEIVRRQLSKGEYEELRDAVVRGGAA